MPNRKQKFWILVADGARGQLFAREGREGSLEPRWTSQATGDNRPTRAINADRPGRSFDRAGPGRHAMEPPTDPHRKAKADFAHELAEVLEDGLNKSAFDQLIIVAPPQALGDLRAAMTDRVRACVVQEINKDLTQLPPHDLPAALAREA